MNILGQVFTALNSTFGRELTMEATKIATRKFSESEAKRLELIKKVEKDTGKKIKHN